MGSRAVALVCRDEEVARARFGSADGATGAVYPRTGRSFVPPEPTADLLGRLRHAITDAGVWDDVDTDWALLDCELLPWSAKAEDLLRHQYAAVGAAARSAMTAAVGALAQAHARGVDVADLLARTLSRANNAHAFTAAYRQYVWPVEGLEGVQIAPFQVHATEGKTWTDRDHGWHLEVADRLVAVAPTLIRETRRLAVDTTDEASVEAGIAW